MIKAIFNGIFSMIQSIVSIILMPINAIINNLFPDFSNAIISATQGIDNIFNSISWAVNILPQSFVLILTTIFTLHLAYLTGKITTKGIIMVMNVIQKVKFW